jgi:hypothetical protein
MQYTKELYQSVVVEIIACSKDSYSDSMARCGANTLLRHTFLGTLSDRSVAVRVDGRL